MKCKEDILDQIVDVVCEYGGLEASRILYDVEQLIKEHRELSRDLAETESVKMKDTNTGKTVSIPQYKNRK